MPLWPTPPKGMCVVARWMIVSLMQPPPNEQLLSTCRSAARSDVNKYRASGFSRPRMKSMASCSRSKVSMGRIGPKISSCITGAPGSTSASSVGSI